MELLTFPDGRKIHQTYAWVVPGNAPSADSIEVLIDPPPAGVPALAIPDLKAWLLADNPQPRLLRYNDQKGNPTAKKFLAAAVLNGYVRAIVRRAGFLDQAQRTIHVLMPALANDKIHFRYRDVLETAVRAALPNSGFETLSEPEMILEFFRLIKNEVKIKQGTNRIFLVVDSGASTTNFTIVLTTRSGQITEASEKRRKHNLRPISSDAALIAGRAIDNQLLASLRPNSIGVDEKTRDELLERIERAKIQVAKTGKGVSVSFAPGSEEILTDDILRNTSKWLWNELQETYLHVAGRLIEQLQKGVGQQVYGRMLAEKKIIAATDVGRLFDAVFVAGGNSLLPGFITELQATLHLPSSTPIHKIGGAYPVAASVGGLAHVLARKLSVQTGDKLPESTDTESDVDFTSSLQVNVVLDCQDKHGVASTPRRVEVLNRNDSVARFGGQIEFPLPKSWSPRQTARARLMPSLSEHLESERPGRKPYKYQNIHVLRSEGTGFGNFDAIGQRLTLRSTDVRGLQMLHFSADRLPPLNSLQSKPLQAAPKQIADSIGLHLVIDLGMSKTVIAHGTSLFQASPSAFDGMEREMPDGPGYDRREQPKATPSEEPDGKNGSSDVPIGKSVVAPNIVNNELVRPVIPIRPLTPETEHAKSSSETFVEKIKTVVEKENGAARPELIATQPPPRQLELTMPPAPTVNGAQLPLPTPTLPVETAPTTIVPDGAFSTAALAHDPHRPGVVGPPRPSPADSATQAIDLTNALFSPLELLTPADRIRATAQAAAFEGVNIDAKQLALAYLALCTRRFVLLAGPPGSGKSTLARMLARMLGCAPENRFTDLSVQAHWVNDDPLFGNEGALTKRIQSNDPFHLVLLDEVNLTRPEYYLARFFGAIDHRGEINGQRLPPMGVVGTLNIDDFSRPPSPKVLDRAMLLIVSPQGASPKRTVRCAWHGASENGPLKTLPPPIRTAPVALGAPSTDAKARILAWVDAASTAFRTHRTMRPDLVPSHRAIDDMLRFAALHNSLGLAEIVSEVEALDHAILGRFISTISGPDLEVRPLLEQWRPLCQDLPETGRRVERLLEQATNHGFASFWQ